MVKLRDISFGVLMGTGLIMCWQLIRARRSSSSSIAPPHPKSDSAHASIEGITIIAVLGGGLTGVFFYL